MTGMGTVTGTASLNTPQATMLTTIIYSLSALRMQPRMQWSTAVLLSLRVGSAKGPGSRCSDRGKVTLDLEFHGDTVLAPHSWATD